MSSYTVTADGTTYDFDTLASAQKFAREWLDQTYRATTTATVVGPDGYPAAVYERKPSGRVVKARIEA